MCEGIRTRDNKVTNPALYHYVTTPHIRQVLVSVLLLYGALTAKGNQVELEFTMMLPHSTGGDSAKGIVCTGMRVL